MISNYGRNTDVSMRVRNAGAGMGFTRSCSSCSHNRVSLGGRLDKRTKMWRCAQCVAAKEAK